MEKDQEKAVWGYPNAEGQELGGLENRLRTVLDRLAVSTESQSDDRKIVVRWFNRLVYEIGTWNEALLSLLAKYDPQRGAESNDYLEGLEARFADFVRAIDQERMEYPAEYIAVRGGDPAAFDICARITFLQQRFRNDLSWMATKDPATYSMLVVAINETVDMPGYRHGPMSELSRKLKEVRTAVFGRYDCGMTRRPVHPKEAKETIAEYRNWSIPLLEQLNRRAREIGVSLLSIREYEDALRGTGPSDSRIYVIGEAAMSGDTYNVGQAVAVGPHAMAQHFSMQQVWQQNAGRFNLVDLAHELDALRSAMRSQASDAEHDVAIGAVAAAGAAAKQGDGPTALTKLQEAGKWAFDVATKIGVTVAAAALKTALGI